MLSQEDEKNFVVNSALLEQLGAVGGELSLADLLSGMDQMLSDAPVADDDIDQLVRIAHRHALQNHPERKKCCAQVRTRSAHDHSILRSFGSVFMLRLLLRCSRKKCSVSVFVSNRVMTATRTLRILSTQQNGRPAWRCVAWRGIFEMGSKTVWVAQLALAHS